MPQIEPTKKYLLAKRGEIMLSLKEEGYSLGDIGMIFNLEYTSTVKRIIDAHIKSLTTNT